MFLLDTNVVSELRRVKPHGAVAAWLATLESSDFCLSAVTAGEIQQGVERTRIHDVMKALEIEAWLVEYLASTLVIPVDAEIFRTWAQLMYGRQQHLAMDAMIAATAIRRGLTLATRNVNDFQQFPVTIFDPFSYR